MWKAIGEFLAALLSGLLPDWKKPNEVESTGFDTDIEDDIDAEIDSEFEFDFNHEDAHKEPKDT